jgi:transcriptional regulator with XRE-family HTH domain
MDSEQRERLTIGMEYLGLNRRGAGREIAKKTGYSYQAISSILNGKRTLTERFIRIFCGAYALSPTWILQGVGEMKISLSVGEMRQHQDTPEEARAEYEEVRKSIRPLMDEVFDRLYASHGYNGVAVAGLIASLTIEDVIDLNYQLTRIKNGYGDEEAAFSAYEYKVKFGLPCDTRLKIERVKYTPPIG